MIQWDRSFKSFFQVEFVSAENASDLFHRGLDLSVGRMVVCVRMFFYNLLQLVDLTSSLSQGVLEQL